MYTIAILSALFISNWILCFLKKFQVDGFINNNNNTLLAHLNSYIEDKYYSSAIIILYY